MSSNGDKKGETKGAAAPLDLGISALLTQNPVDASDDLGESPVEGSNDSSKDAEQPEESLSEFEQLYQDRSWAELVKIAEAKLSLADEPEYRLWWVRGHLGAFSMPVSFLAAPLEAVCRRARDQQLTGKLLPILAEAGEVALARLTEVGSRDQAESLRDSLVDAGVLERVQGRRGRMPAPSSRPNRDTLITSAQEQPAEKAQRSTSPLPKVSKGWSPAYIGTTIVGLLVLLGLGWGIAYQSHTFFGVPAVIAAENFVSQPSLAEQLIPPLERRGPVGSLSALFYSIEQPTSDTTAVSAAGDISNSGSAAVHVPVRPSEPGAAAKANPPARQSRRATGGQARKETVNTRSPVEGPDLKERLRRREGRSRRDSAPEPTLPGTERNPSPPVLENRNPDLFDPGGVFRVLVRTSVLAHPSYSAEVVGRLERGDRVFVEAKLGRWVRLRSKRGSSGFVLAEDLAQVPPEAAARQAY
jgi:hypothetical protein